MQIGQAFYCDDCGCEIVSGSHCKDCNAVSGSSQITYTLVAVQQRDTIVFLPEDDKPLWKKLLGL